MSQQNLPDPGAVARASYIRMIEKFEPPAGVWR
jgi:hypothetical protein